MADDDTTIEGETKEAADGEVDEASREEEVATPTEASDGAAATPGAEYMWDCRFCGRANVARSTACTTCTAARGREPKDFSEVKRS